MVRHGRDGGFAVVRPDCDVLQTGALMQVQSEQPLSWSCLETERKWTEEVEGHGQATWFVSHLICDVKLSVCRRRTLICRRQAWRASHHSGVHRNCTNVPYAPHLRLRPPSDPADSLRS